MFKGNVNKADTTSFLFVFISFACIYRLYEVVFSFKNYPPPPPPPAIPAPRLLVSELFHPLQLFQPSTPNSPSISDLRVEDFDVYLHAKYKLYHSLLS